MSDHYVIIRKRRRVLAGAAADAVLVPSGVQTHAESLDVDVVTGRQALAQARADPEFQACGPSMPMKLIAPMAISAVAAPVEGAASMTTTWGVRAVGAETSPFDGTDVVVAVLDTGIDAQHPSFAGVHLTEKDFTGDGNGDVHGHGTHCAGTIFGRDVNGLRIGIARGVTRALIGKVIGNRGGTSADIATAIQWAIENGAHVISMSLGIDFPGYQKQLMTNQGLRLEPATSLALEGYRQNLNVFDSVAALVGALAPFHQASVLVAAAGNESRRDEVPPFEIAASPPAVSPGFISAAALRESPQGLAVADFSNIGANVSGPGVGIISAKRGGGLVSMDGTSMATPHVAGVTALWVQKLKQSNQLTSQLLTASVLASATRAGLEVTSTFEAVGVGIARAPQQ
jgi:subtilisin family serine protease